MANKKQLMSNKETNCNGQLKRRLTKYDDDKFSLNICGEAAGDGEISFSLYTRNIIKVVISSTDKNK